MGHICSSIRRGRLRFAQRGALQENLTLVFAVAAILILAFLFFF